MNFDSCPHCDGLVPNEHTTCPHCDHAMGGHRAKVARAAKAATKVVVAGAAAMTLMACYGVGYYDDDDGQGQGTIDPEVACGSASDLTLEASPNGERHTAYVSGTTDGGSHAFTSCAGASGSTPERLFTLDPGAMRGQAGTLTVLVAGDRHTVWTADRCDEFTDDVAVCTEPGGTSLELDVASLQATTIAVEGLSTNGGDFELQVIFEPRVVN